MGNIISCKMHVNDNNGGLIEVYGLHLCFLIRNYGLELLQLTPDTSI